MLELTPAAALPGALDWWVAPTLLGRAVLAGEVDRIRTAGVDGWLGGWLGGCRLEGRGAIWRWDPDHAAPARC